MIERFTDHAANERTFLAWVRTAIAIVGFGLIIVRIEGTGLASLADRDSGVMLVILGIALIVASALRFLMLRRSIRSSVSESVSPLLLDAALGIALLIMVVTLMIFAWHVTR